MFLKQILFKKLFNNLGLQILNANGDLSKIRAILETICPRMHAHGTIKRSPWSHLMVAPDDHEVFRGHVLTPLCPVVNMVVPKLRGLPDHYRLVLRNKLCIF